MSDQHYASHVYGLVLPPKEPTAAALYTTLLNTEWQIEVAPNWNVDPTTVVGSVALDALTEDMLTASDLHHWNSVHRSRKTPLDPTGFLYLLADRGSWGFQIEQLVIGYPMKLVSGQWADEEAAFPGRRAAVEAALQQVSDQLRGAGLPVSAPRLIEIETRG